MDVTIHIPYDVAARLGTADLPRRVLEAFAVEEFRQGRLTQPELRRLLGFATRQSLDAFLRLMAFSCHIRSKTWRKTGMIFGVLGSDGQDVACCRRHHAVELSCPDSASQSSACPVR